MLRGRFLLPDRRRWRAEDARSVLARLDASGLALGEFAARYGLSTQRLYRWRVQLRAEKPAFVEISAPRPSAPIEVVLRSGHVLRVPDGFGAAMLRRLVETLDDQGAEC
jgi:transposase-like protein